VNPTNDRFLPFSQSPSEKNDDDTDPTVTLGPREYNDEATSPPIEDDNGTVTSAPTEEEKENKSSTDSSLSRLLINWINAILSLFGVTLAKV